jgi:outer membrane lipoprotein-sorting protein
MVTMHGDTEGFTAEIWAKGNNVRSEIAFGDQKVVTIQRGDTMYTFGSNSHVGNKTQFEAGLASLGLILQIATVKSKGKKDSTHNVDGTVYDLYVYEVDAPHEIARVLLNSKTSLPQDWDSTVKNADGAPATVRMKFRNLAANVDVPDELFALPPDVQFSEVPAAELLALGTELANPTSEAAELVSLHGNVLVGEREDHAPEIWAEGDKSRTVSVQGKIKSVSIQIGDTLFNYREGSTTGTKQQLRSGLSSMGLVRRIAEVKANGVKEPTQKIEGKLYNKYTYGANLPAEAATVFLSSETSLPAVWISAIERSDTGKSVVVEQFRNMQANVEIPKGLFDLPPNVTFSEEPTAESSDSSERPPQP